MKIDFGMWKKALNTLVKMDSAEEFGRLDVISKWLIVTRSAVTVVTIYSGVIAGLLAWRDGYFSFVPWLIVTLGLFIAHGTNNLLNDYTDFSRGIDQDYYFRTQYGVHPLVQKFWDKPTQLKWFYVSGVLAVLSGIFALVYTGIDPVVVWLFAFGALVLLYYTWPLKYLGLGELAIFLIWGPIMIAAVYIVLAKGWTDNVWNVALAAVPWGLSVVSINIAKHTDKIEPDRLKKVGTLPVRIGEKAARRLTQAALVLIYLMVLYLVFRAALLHAADADRLLRDQAADHGAEGAAKPEAGRGAARVPVLAGLVLGFLLQPQPDVRRAVHPGADPRHDPADLRADFLACAVRDELGGGEHA